MPSLVEPYTPVRGEPWAPLRNGTFAPIRNDDQWPGKLLIDDNRLSVVDSRSGSISGRRGSVGEGRKPTHPHWFVSAPGKVILFGEHAVVHGVVRFSLSHYNAHADESDVDRNWCLCRSTLLRTRFAQRRQPDLSSSPRLERLATHMEY